jgi:hypothetical protein
VLATPPREVKFDPNPHHIQKLIIFGLKTKCKRLGSQCRGKIQCPWRRKGFLQDRKHKLGNKI